MNRFITAAFALVLGILLGAWQPRGELLRLRAELDASTHTDCKNRALNPVETLLGVNHSENAAVPPVKPIDKVDEPSGPVPEPAVALETPPVETPSEGPPPVNDNDILSTENIEEAKALVEARRAQAMAALVEQADLDEDQEKAVVAVFDKMNEQIQASAEDFVDTALSRGNIERRDMLAFGADMLDAAVVAEDSLHAQLPPELMKDLDPELYNPLNFVGGAAADSLLRLKDMPLPENP